MGNKVMNETASEGRLSLGVLDELVSDVCQELFASLRRSEQRVIGERYVRGLISVSGRKTMRSIAEGFGGGPEQQKIQHFISSSTWNWMSVRRALFEYLATVEPPEALVVRRMIVPKSGNHTVGVERMYVRGLGRTVNSQQAFGAWHVDSSRSVPVNWKLHLPQSWLTDTTRRRRAGIPDHCEEGFVGESACRSVLEIMAASSAAAAGVPGILDIGPLDTEACLRTFADAGVPVLLRINDRLSLRAEDPAHPSYGAGLLPARQLAESVGTLRRPALWADASRTGSTHRSCAATARVGLPGVSGPLRLLAEWDEPGPRTDRMWLTTVKDRSPGELLRMAKLTLRTDHDFAETARQVGIQDFEGRSFQGWHRHATLASIAHAIVMMEPAALLDPVFDEQEWGRVS